MIRKSVLSLAIAAGITAVAMGSTASTASAGYYGSHYKGHGYGYNYGHKSYCKKVVVGYKTIWSKRYYRWIEVPIWRTKCYGKGWY